jgi:hypothetical protein
VITYNWKQEYAVETTHNPVIEFLKKEGYNSRVALIPLHSWVNLGDPAVAGRPEIQAQIGLLCQYQKEWLQKQFPYNDIASLDVVQLPRVPLDYQDFEVALSANPIRHWQLTGTKYLLGVADIRQILGLAAEPSPIHVAHNPNGQELRFELVPKAGLAQADTEEDVTAALMSNGRFGIFEVAGALPRVAMADQWKVIADPKAALAYLASPGFDPAKSVVLEAGPPSAATGAGVARAEVLSYHPKRVSVRTRATAPRVVLLNNKFDPNWHARIDGQPAKLVRCNYIAQGVLVPPGEHTVVFQYQPSLTPFAVSACTVAGALAGVAGLACARRRKEETKAEKGPTN